MSRSTITSSDIIFTPSTSDGQLYRDSATMDGNITIKVPTEVAVEWIAKGVGVPTSQPVKGINKFPPNLFEPRINAFKLGEHFDRLSKQQADKKAVREKAPTNIDKKKKAGTWGTDSYMPTLNNIDYAPGVDHYSDRRASGPIHFQSESVPLNLKQRRGDLDRAIETFRPQLPQDAHGSAANSEPVKGAHKKPVKPPMVNDVKNDAVAVEFLCDDGSYSKETCKGCCRGCDSCCPPLESDQLDHPPSLVEALRADTETGSVITYRTKSNNLKNGIPLVNLPPFGSSDKARVREAKACHGCLDGCNSCCPLSEHTNGNDLRKRCSGRRDDRYTTPPPPSELKECLSCGALYSGSFSIGRCTQCTIIADYRTLVKEADEIERGASACWDTSDNSTSRQAQEDEDEHEESDWNDAIEPELALGQAFATLGLKEWKSVTFDILNESFRKRLAEKPESAVEYGRAYSVILQHQNENDTWVNVEVQGNLSGHSNDEKSCDEQTGCDGEKDSVMSRGGWGCARFPNRNDDKEENAWTNADGNHYNGGWGSNSEDQRGPAWGSEYNHVRGSSRADFNEPLEGTHIPNEKLSTNLNVTYCAIVKSGTQTVHIPIDSKNVSGPEKTVVTNGMKKIWQWIVVKDLGDKVGLQDAYYIAKEMHDDSEGERLRCSGW